MEVNSTPLSPVYKEQIQQDTPDSLISPASDRNTTPLSITSKKLLLVSGFVIFIVLLGVQFLDDHLQSHLNEFWVKGIDLLFSGIIVVTVTSLVMRKQQELYKQKLQEITVRQKAEEALRQSEERFRLAFEEGPLGMALVDLNLRFISVNRAL